MEKTADRVGVSKNTVKAVWMRHPEDSALVKKELAAKMFAVADEAVRITGERLDECHPAQSAVIAGIMTQRGSELRESTKTDRDPVLIVHEALLARLLIRAELKEHGKLPPETPKQAAEKKRLEEAWPEEFLLRSIDWRLRMKRWRKRGCVGPEPKWRDVDEIEAPAAGDSNG